MRILSLSGFLLWATLTYAQKTGFAQKWEYGVHFHFNNSIVKPIASDTFTNKSSVGAGLLLERKFSKFGVQVIPGFAQTRYADDIRNRNAVTNALDLALNVSHPLDNNRQTFLTYGLMGGFALQHKERNLDGTEVNTGYHNLLVSEKPFEIGARLGVGLDLSPGTRLTLSYIDYFGGQQNSGRITGRIDYLQLGLQLRINELTSSDRINERFEKEQAKNELARKQARSLKHGNNGLLVFVLGTLKKDYIGPPNAYKDSVNRVRNIENREALIAAIQTHYRHGEFVVTNDSLFDFRTPEKLTIMVGHGTSTISIPPEKEVFYARIDELFIESNGNLKWGIFVFDEAMNMLQEPFPFFTPYRNLDQRFESANNMLTDFNNRLKLLSD
ncbi:MAG: hypothetical protein JJ975_08990 [Bacteroidia bacterium]|nr:hypothetical protein [Bacteroidia bacterium]